MKQRNYLFDNVKILLIVCVVLGHILSNATPDNEISNFLSYIIYTFHMPLFIFISGFFSKNLNQSCSQIAVKCLLPFGILNTSYALIFQDEIPMELFQVQYTFWFLICLFIWKVSLKYLIKIPMILPISITLSILSGLLPAISILPRTIGFLPFFLLGYFCNEKGIHLIRKIPKVASLLMLVLNLCCIFLLFHSESIPRKVFYHDFSYDFFNHSMLESIGIGCLTLILAITMSLCIMNLAPHKKGKFSHIGQNTLSIYCAHIFIIMIIKRMAIFPIENLSAPFQTTFCIIGAIFISYILGSKRVNHMISQGFSHIKIILCTIIRPIKTTLSKS